MRPRDGARDPEGGVEGVRADARSARRGAGRALCCGAGAGRVAPKLRRPAALEHGRLFMSTATPAKLFRVLLAGDPASRARGGGFEPHAPAEAVAAS